jgi:hypothetical protein
VYRLSSVVCEVDLYKGKVSTPLSAVNERQKVTAINGNLVDVI